MHAMCNQPSSGEARPRAFAEPDPFWDGCPPAARLKPLDSATLDGCCAVRDRRRTVGAALPASNRFAAVAALPSADLSASGERRFQR